MTFLGIDPGSRTCGYGILETEKRKIIAVSFDIIKLNPSSPLAERIERIYETIVKVLQQYKPERVGIETIFFGKNIQSAFTLGHVRGGILLAVSQHKIPLKELSPREVKKAVTGNGNASKQQVQYMLPKLLNLKIDNLPEDAADALAVAYSIYNNERFGN